MAKLKNYESQTAKQCKDKLQNVLKQAADVNVEHHAYLDHCLFHVKKKDLPPET